MNKTNILQTKKQIIKSRSQKALNVGIRFICEVVEAAFAMIGIMQFIHTDTRVQTGLAIFIVLLILVVRFQKKK